MILLVDHNVAQASGDRVFVQGVGLPDALR
jgi:hypothetical protein